MADPKAQQQRFGYIDWLRGLVCVMMFIVHGYDSWLNDASRGALSYRLSQELGTIPAPMFLFLAGVSVSLVTTKLRQKSVPAADIARKSIARGAEILVFGYLFRLQEFLLGLPKSPWQDLLRVDILTTIGLSIIFMSIVCWLAQSRRSVVIVAIVLTATVALATPPLYTTWRPRWLPWFLESYVNGVHTHDAPQAWLFPVFPWTAFAFAGLAVGFILFSDWGRTNVAKAVTLTGGVGVVLFAASTWIDAYAPQIYATYDYWHTSPNFFLARLGILMAMMPMGYVWCRWGPGEVGFSPLIQLGKTSLLVYWVHIIFVYGRLSIFPKRMQTVPVATLGILIVTLAMLALSIVRTRSEGRGPQIRAWFRQKMGIAART